MSIVITVSAGAAPPLTKPTGAAERDSCTCIARQPRGFPQATANKEVTKNAVATMSGNHCLGLEVEEEKRPEDEVL